MSRLLDAVGLVLVVHEKDKVLAMSPALPAASSNNDARHLAPREFDKASFIDGSKAKILNWGKVPR